MTEGREAVRFIQHEVVDSTNECAFRAIEAGDARHGDVHLAREQTAGRGRLGRAWHSPKGEGLYLSAIVMPKPPAPPAPALTIGAGLAAFDVVTTLGVPARLKWPNDVLVGDAKLAGLLVETRGLDPQRPCYVVGIGMNVGQRSFPSELTDERPVTSLRREGVNAGVEEIAKKIAGALFVHTASFDPASLDRLAESYLGATGLRDARVRVVDAGERTLSGRLTALSIPNGLTVRNEQGDDHTLALELVRSVTLDGPGSS